MARVTSELPLVALPSPFPGTSLFVFVILTPKVGEGDGGRCCAVKSRRRKWSWVLSWLCPDDV